MRRLTRGVSALLACTIAAALLLASPTSARAADPLPPELTQPVNDFAHVIDPTSAAQIDRQIRALRAATGDVVVVATIDTVDPYADIREYIVKMFENHGRGVGDKGKNNGLLVLVAVQDHRVQVEVGYDIEPFVTDGYAGEVSRTYMAPAFARGDYGAGLQAGVQQLIGRIAEQRGVSIDGVPAPSAVRENGRGIALTPGTIIFIIILLILVSRMGRQSRSGMIGRGGRWGGGGWSGWNSGVGPFGGGGGFGGGGFGGGFGGFGGGSSGGGGGGASW